MWSISCFLIISPIISSAKRWRKLLICALRTQGHIFLLFAKSLSAFPQSESAKNVESLKINAFLKAPAFITVKWQADRPQFNRR
jgi:hypothetical protein